MLTRIWRVLRWYQPWVLYELWRMRRAFAQVRLEESGKVDAQELEDYREISWRALAILKGWEV